MMKRTRKMNPRLSRHSAADITSTEYARTK
jgi:hypothetical protein